MEELRRCTGFCKQLKPATAEYFRDRRHRECRDCYNRRHRVYRKTHRARTMLTECRRRGRKRGLSVTVTEEWLERNILSKPCFYCGEKGNSGPDRVDHDKGYGPKNLVAACVSCNRVRSDVWSVEEMKIIGRTLRFLRERANTECADSIPELHFLR